jgi:hypothetical protein
MKGGIWPPEHSHVCEAPGCSEPSPTSRTCGNSCRTKLWKLEHHYRDPRRDVRNVSQRPRRRREARYAIVQSVGPHLDVLGFETAASKRAAEGLFGIRDRDDLHAVAARHLPAVA